MPDRRWLVGRRGWANFASLFEDVLAEEIGVDGNLGFLGVVVAFSFEGKFGYVFWCLAGG